MTDIIEKYVNDYKLHIIVPNEIENFDQFSTELGYCLRYIRSSKSGQKLRKLLSDYQDVYSNFDKMSGHLIQVVTNTKLPKEAENEELVNMCKAIEDMIKDALEEEIYEMAKRFFETGGTLETALKVFPSLSEEVLLSIKEGI